jgi:hypothetical protein
MITYNYTIDSAALQVIITHKMVAELYELNGIWKGEGLGLVLICKLSNLKRVPGNI